MFLSKRYFASPLSSWSQVSAEISKKYTILELFSKRNAYVKQQLQTVYVDRMAKGITDDESILDVFLPGVEGLPQARILIDLAEIFLIIPHSFLALAGTVFWQNFEKTKNLFEKSFKNPFHQLSWLFPEGDQGSQLKKKP